MAGTGQTGVHGLAVAETVVCRGRGWHKRSECQEAEERGFDGWHVCVGSVVCLLGVG